MGYKCDGGTDFNGGGYDLANRYANKTNNRGETEMNLPYQAVSVATMLRDYIEVEYINDEHKRLCDCADTVYNAGISREMWNDNPDYDYKGLYDRYGKEFWADVFKDMDAIDTQLDAYNAEDLEDDYNYIKRQLTEEK